ncbi:hypothetical protein KKI24_05290 [bacterium]|nr:hypothetical protein [bacterium]
MDFIQTAVRDSWKIFRGCINLRIVKAFAENSIDETMPMPTMRNPLPERQEFLLKRRRFLSTRP